MDATITALLNYLIAAPAEVRHLVLRHYPANLPIAPVIACLKDDPATEKATALLMYWLMHPRFSKQFEAEEARSKETESFGEIYYDLIEDLERKYVAGFYTAQHIGYDPYYDYSRETGYLSEKRRVPSMMNVPVYGQAIDAATYDRDHNLQHGLTKEVKDILQGTDADSPLQVKTDMETRQVPEVAVAPEPPIITVSKVPQAVWPIDNEPADVPVEQTALPVTDDFEPEVQQEEIPDEAEFDPYAPRPVIKMDTQHSRGGCFTYLAIIIFVIILFRMCDNA